MINERSVLLCLREMCLDETKNTISLLQCDVIIPTKHYIILLIIIIYKTSAVKTNFSDRIKMFDRCRPL